MSAAVFYLLEKQRQGLCHVEVVFDFVCCCYNFV